MKKDKEKKVREDTVKKEKLAEVSRPKSPERRDSPKVKQRRNSFGRGR